LDLFAATAFAELISRWHRVKSRRQHFERMVETRKQERLAITFKRGDSDPPQGGTS
jgi:hypothetical protein